jgi:hypothetical protein
MKENGTRTFITGKESSFIMMVQTLKVHGLWIKKMGKEFSQINRE